MDNQELLNEIAKMMEEQTRRIEIKLENEVTKRIDSLFDGYKLNREKQWELERRLDALEKRVEKIEIAG